jgi:hypothetical protein
MVHTTVTTVLLVKPLLCELAFMTKIHCVGSLDGNLLKTTSGSTCMYWYVCESVSVLVRDYCQVELQHVSLTRITTGTNQTDLFI